LDSVALQHGQQLEICARTDLLPPPSFFDRGQWQVRSSASESVSSKLIGSTGGFIEVPGRVRVVFPTRFFVKPETVTLRISADPTTDTARAGYELWGAGGPYLSFDVLVEVGQEPQADYEVTITLPGDYLRRIPSNFKPAAFREVFHGSQAEPHYFYEGLPTEFDGEHRRLRVKVPKLKYYRLEQLYDTIVVGCVPR
jgi:hypothetical protein